MTAAMQDPIHILLVEDNPGDVDLARDALAQFKTPYTVHVANDGARALEYLAGSAAHRLPDLILLDLNLPKIDGREVLATIKNEQHLAQIPVIVLTSSEAEHDLLQAYRSHANCYLTKSVDLELHFAMFEQIERFWLQLVKLPPSPLGS